MAKKGKDLWSALEGQKDQAKETVGIEFGDVEGEVTVVFRDLDDVQLIQEEYEAKMPDKPVIEIGDTGTMIEVPSEEEKYEKFNDHPKAIQWKEDTKPLRKEKLARLAYEFIAEDERPSDDAEEGTDILNERLRMTDLNDIVNAGFELNGLNQQLEEARKNS